MAGLTRSINIVTSKNRAFPDWPRPHYTSPSVPYYGSQSYQNDSNKRYFPGFLNFGSSGSSLANAISNNSNDNWYMYNAQGTQQSAGSWNSGWAKNDPWSDADRWVAAYMDSVDNKLYMLVVDAGTNPDTVRMVSIDKDGNTVNETAAFQVTNTALEEGSNYWSYDSCPILYRVGQADGTGNFRFDRYKANTDDNDGSEPYDGVRLEINTSSGTVNSIAANTIAETSDGIIANNLYYPDPFTLTAFMGPTDNGIIGAPTNNAFSNYNVYSNRLYGMLGNTTTGQFFHWTFFGRDTPFYSLNYSYKPVPWLGSYIFCGHGGTTQVAGALNYSKTDMHNYLDEVAVWYGIL